MVAKTKYFCDRCRKEMSDFGVEVRIYSDFPKKWKAYDVCKKCAKKLVKFIEK